MYKHFIAVHTFSDGKKVGWHYTREGMKVKEILDFYDDLLVVPMFISLAINQIDSDDLWEELLLNTPDLAEIYWYEDYQDMMQEIIEHQHNHHHL